MWFATKIVYGYCLGPYTKKCVEIQKIISQSNQPFKLFALIPEIYTNCNLDSMNLYSILFLFIGFEVQHRSFEDIQCLKTMLQDYVQTTEKIAHFISSPNADFHAGLDIERHFLLFDEKSDEFLLFFD